MKSYAALPVLAICSLAACDAPVPEAASEKPATSAATSTTKPAAPKPTATPRPKPTATESAAPVEAKGPFPESTDPLLKDVAKANAKAPAKFVAKFETTQGDFEVECTRDWAPIAIDRFYNLVKIGYFDDIAFFRVVQNPKPFVVQFGIHGNPEVSKLWSEANLDREEVKQSNTRGMLTFAMSGKSDTPKKTTATRSTQLFINYGDNAMLDEMGFAPLCKVTGDGMSVVDKLYSGYGDKLTSQQDKLVRDGNKFLREKFPALDYIKTARLAGDDKKDAKDDKDAKPAGSAAPKASAKPKSTAAPKATATP